MRKRRDGFTLIELLVVMAIIAILAAIVVPNVAQYITKGRVTRALSECQSIELALTKMMTDAGRSELGQFFKTVRCETDGPYYPAVHWWVACEMNVDPTVNPANAAEYFKLATKVYSNTFYALLREGRGVLAPGVAPDPDLNFVYADLLDGNVVRKLGTNYLDIGDDPWGAFYNIYPGPWSSRKGPSVFRIYMPETDKQMPGAKLGSGKDDLTVETVENVVDVRDQETQEPIVIGYPAPKNQIAFIWSNGANMKSSQALYTFDGGYLNQDKTVYYDSTQDVDYCGGGDDINNWDNGQSWGRFYN